jgi:hypothetical protein
MRRVLISIALVLTIAAAGACSSDENEEKEAASASATCDPAPASIVDTGLPTGFPAPTGVRYSSTSKAGPSTVVEGYSSASLEDVYNGFKKDLAEAPFSVTKSEKEEHDAEVNFAAADSTGQVALSQPCEGRTGVKVTVRPK